MFYICDLWYLFSTAIVVSILVSVNRIVRTRHSCARGRVIGYGSWYRHLQFPVEARDTTTSGLQVS